MKSSAATSADDPSAFVTTTWPAPVVAAHGTVAVIDVSLPMVNVAAAPLMVTDDAGGVLKLVPVMVTEVPRTPVPEPLR